MSIRRSETIWIGAIAVAAGACLAAAGGGLWLQRHQTKQVAQAMTGGHPARAPAHFRRYGCSGCHTIPGIPAADGLVGGKLENLRTRVYIAGAAPNSPQNLVQWIVAPQSFAAHSAMPATGITPDEARDVAAYLYTR